MKPLKILNAAQVFLFFLIFTSLTSCSQDGTSGTNPTCSNCKIFITGSTSTGNIGTKAQADVICAIDTNYPGTGTYKAMLVYADGSRQACSTSNCSGGVSENVDWVLHPNTTYTRADGSAIIGTTTAAGIFTFPLTNSFSATGTTAWIGTRTDWTTNAVDATCTNWTNGDGANPPRGSVGVVSFTDASAIAFGVNCDFVSKFICVEQ